jgi:hypothetical protein
MLIAVAMAARASYAGTDLALLVEELLIASTHCNNSLQVRNKWSKSHPNINQY